MANLGDCAPPNTDNQLNIHSDADKATAYGMNHDEFIAIVEEKARIFGADGTSGTPLDKYFDVIADVIYNNFLSYDQISGFINDLDGKETELNQFDHSIQHVPIVRPYPWQEYFDRYIRHKSILVLRLTILLNHLKPAYKYNERLVQMFSNIDLKTCIDLGLYNQMSEKARKVIDINKSIGILFEKFEIFEYQTIFKAQQLATERLQTEQRGFGLDKADLSTNALARREKELFSEMMNILDKALELDFETLVGSTERFHELFHESIRHQLPTGAASSSETSENTNVNAHN